MPDAGEPPHAQASGRFPVLAAGRNPSVRPRLRLPVPIGPPAERGPAGHRRLLRLRDRLGRRARNVLFAFMTARPVHAQTAPERPSPAPPPTSPRRRTPRQGCATCPGRDTERRPQTCRRAHPSPSGVARSPWIPGLACLCKTGEETPHVGASAGVCMRTVDTGPAPPTLVPCAAGLTTTVLRSSSARRLRGSRTGTLFLGREKRAGLDDSTCYVQPGSAHAHGTRVAHCGGGDLDSGGAGTSCNLQSQTAFSLLLLILNPFPMRKYRFEH